MPCDSGDLVPTSGRPTRRGEQAIRRHRERLVGWALATLLVGMPVPASSAGKQLLPKIGTPIVHCPPFVEGPMTIGNHTIRVVTLGREGKAGPMLLYWHGTGTDPMDELATALDGEARRSLRREGGVVVAFLESTREGRSTSGNQVWFERDMDLADRAVECAVAAGRADPARIHAMGMSAGGLHVAALSYRRAHYLAGVISLSGGHLIVNGHDMTPTASSMTENPVAALIIHGGGRDEYILRFAETSAAFADNLRQRGHPVLICDHGAGHTIPAAVSDVAWQFVRTRRFGDPTSLDSIRGSRAARVLCRSSISN